MYDLGLFLVGLPLAFLATKRLSTTINGLVGDEITTLSVMAYAYVFFSAIWLYRLLFSYMRWVLPVNEITVNARRRAPHRFILTTVLLALLGEVIHSIVVISTTP